MFSNLSWFKFIQSDNLIGYRVAGAARTPKEGMKGLPQLDPFF